MALTREEKSKHPYLSWSGSNVSIYKSPYPGAPYQHFLDVPTENEIVLDRDSEIMNFSSQGLFDSVILGWDDVSRGDHSIYKIVPHGSPTPTMNYSWLTNGNPPGASWTSMNGMEWVDHCIVDGQTIMMTATDGGNYSEVSGATNSIVDRYIILYVWIERGSVPDSIMFSFFDGSWLRKVHFGRRRFEFSDDKGWNSRIIGGIPVWGCWTPIIIDLDHMGVGEVTGMRFGIWKDNGTAKMYIDSIYSSNQPVYAAPDPKEFIGYEIQKSLEQGPFTYLDTVRSTSYTDDEVKDLRVAGVGGFTFYGEASSDGRSVTIRWTTEEGSGTLYRYRIRRVDSTGIEHPWYMTESYVSSSNRSVKIYRREFNDTYTYLGESISGSFTDSGLLPNEEYRYKLETYNIDSELRNTKYIDIKTRASSSLGEFELGSSLLA